MKTKIKFTYTFFVLIIVAGLLFNSNTTFGKVPKTKKHNSKVTTKKQKLINESLKKLKTYLMGFDGISFDLISVKNTTFASTQTTSNIFSNEFLKEKLLSNILVWLGTPYRMGGTSKSGVDCSNFVAQIIRQTLSINFPANAERQSKLFVPIKNIDELSFGDLIFFSGRNKKSKRIGHVGIYLGNGIFAHSSTGKGVIITHISESYYSERFRFGGKLSYEHLNIVSN